MKGLYQNSFIVAFIIVLCFGVGCSDSASKPPRKEPTVQTIPAVPVKDTPIQYRDVNGARLAYREFGSGVPLLIIGGLGATMEQVKDTALGILASKYHVFRYDHWGMGLPYPVRG